MFNLPHSITHILTASVVAGILSSAGVSAQFTLGLACTADADCYDEYNSLPVFCGPDGTCGGGQAQCEPDMGSPSDIGESSACVSGVCKGGNKCANPGVSGLGGSCSSFYDCRDRYVQCGNGVCGGGGVRCQTLGGFYSTGTSYDCASTYCRNNVCSNTPRAGLGDACSVDLDCTGYDEGIAFNCGTDSKCGGNGAACQANDGSAEGVSYYCVSEYCSAGFCSSGSNASPTPNAKRHVLQPGQIRQQLCSAGMVACPVQPKGYECINTNSDLEACGGCPGTQKADGSPAGVDCTALPNVDVVSCVDGACAIESCMAGYVYTAQNATCVAV